MTRILGRRSYAIGERQDVTDDLMRRVREVSGADLSPDDVHIRSGIVCNNLVDHYSTQFTDRALQQIVDLWNHPHSAPNWHRQHDSYSAEGGLPIGRGFMAELERMGPDAPELRMGVEATGVRGWWYYPKNDPIGDQIDRWVRMKIWRELSLAWWMRSYTCDVDGKDVEGESDYFPGQVLENGRIVIGIMDDVVELSEFSLVSRGGQLATSIDGAKSGGHTVAGAIASARARVESRGGVRRPADPWESWRPAFPA